MKRTVFLLALGLVLGAAARWATSPIAPLTDAATPEAWHLD